MNDANSSAERLEQLWSSEFGDAYVERNRASGEIRGDFWKTLMSKCSPQRVLEVGCNVGGNLGWFSLRMPAGSVYGVDVNLKALKELRSQYPSVNAVLGTAKELPFRDGYFDFVFTCGVLIHQPEQSLHSVMEEIVRCSSRWVFCAEYFAERTTEVPYRGHEGALFKRDYGALYKEGFPSLKLVDEGFLGRDTGWDDITYWLFEKG